MAAYLGVLVLPLQVNKKTRTSAYQLLVDIAHELDDARPLTVNGGAADSDDEMDYDGQELSGGLIDFVNAVMAGLVGASPHMQVSCAGLGA
jgi:ribosomal RNA-processing protein 12